MRRGATGESQGIVFVGRWPDAGGRGGGGGHRISRRSMWMTTPCCSAVAFTGGDSDGTAAGSGQRIRILAVLRSLAVSIHRPAGRTVNYPQGEPLQRQIRRYLHKPASNI